jgi:glycosyltransferase involved in cell wall biosynthesis
VPARDETPPLRLLYLGMLSEPKGAFDLIRAVAAMPATAREALRLIMAGHGEVEKARELVRGQGLGDTIAIRGWVDPAQRDALFGDVHGLVLPSHFEGMPMSLLEAMSWELAVIATPVGAIPDVIVDGENGLLVPVADTAALAAAMLRLLEDPALRQRLAAEGKRSVEPFSPDVYAQRLTRLYRGLTAGNALAEAS